VQSVDVLRDVSRVRARERPDFSDLSCDLYATDTCALRDVVRAITA
jgi:hypothetical protein